MTAAKQTKQTRRHNAERGSLFSNLSRVVVKVGTRILSKENHHLDKKSLGKISGHVAEALGRDIEVILVTSGSVGSGMGVLGLKKQPSKIEDKQACAAVGQSRLMHEYERAFKKRGIQTAQVLLTRKETSDRNCVQNIRRVLEKLMGDQILPIINENDVVSVDELKFGDNDFLSGLVAELVGADLLILLTDVDGLLSEHGEVKTRISVVPTVTKDLLSIASGPGSSAATGGMITKLETADRMSRAGKLTVIGNGKETNVIKKILDGKDVGTVFLPSGKKMASRKKWIADYLLALGSVTVDSGAARALTKRGGSLLPSGIVAVDGDFGRGSAIRVLSETGGLLAQGLALYGKSDIERIKGSKSSAIAEILGYSNGDEVIHRNDLVIK